MTKRRWVPLGWVFGATWLLAGCDQLGIETPAKATERTQAEAKAIGGACRHAMRAIEDCYLLNPKADKSWVFTGWREMDEYMRENKLEGVAPTVPRPPVNSPKKKRGDDEEAEEDVLDTPASSATASGPAAQTAPAPPASSSGGAKPSAKSI